MTLTLFSRSQGHLKLDFFCQNWSNLISFSNLSVKLKVIHEFEEFNFFVNESRY